MQLQSYAVDATAPANATKDQMRLMMQALLAERCKLVVHFETREIPVLAVTLVHPGKTAPKLRPHSEGPPCPDEYTGARPTGADEAFPPDCEIAGMTLAKTVRWGSRNLTMPSIANAVYEFSRADKPVVDQTGLNGRFDFMVEITREEYRGSGTSSPDVPAAAPPGTAFVNAMREQLGLKLASTKAPVRIFVVDHVERPSEN